MPLFGRRRPAPGPVVPPGPPGLAEQATAQGWQPVAGPPFHHHVVDGIHDITRAMYGAPRQTDTTQRTVGDTTFSDALRAAAGGRTVIVANAHTYIDPALFQAGHLHPDVAVCAVELASRVTEVLDIVTAIPGPVMPSQVDHATDDLVARISRLDDVNDAIAFLQGLTPDERERLARSDTPLAAFADVQTPEEALARFGSLPEAQRMQVLAMFNRVDGR